MTRNKKGHRRRRQSADNGKNRLKKNRGSVIVSTSPPKTKFTLVEFVINEPFVDRAEAIAKSTNVRIAARSPADVQRLYSYEIAMIGDQLDREKIPYEIDLNRR